MLNKQKSKKVSPAFIYILLFCVLIAGSTFYISHRFSDPGRVKYRCEQQVDSIRSRPDFGNGSDGGKPYTGFLKQYYDNCVENGGEVEDGKFLID